MLSSLRKNKILKNASWIIGCKIVQTILSVLVTMISARYLGPSNYGLISYAAAVVTFVSPVALLGLGNVQVQEFVNFPEQEGKIIGSSLLMSMLSSLACIFGVISFSLISNVNEIDTIVVCSLYSIMLIFQATQLIEYWYQYKYLSKYSSVVSFIAYVIVSTYKIFLLISKLSVYMFAISTALDYLIISSVLIFIYKRKDGQKISFDRLVAKRILEKSKHYIIPNMMVAIFTQTDHIMLMQMMGNEYTGYYSAATTCAAFANFVFTAIVDSARPQIFENYKISETKFEKSMITLFSVDIYMALLYGIALTVGAPLIIKILYGNQYLAAIPALKVVAWLTLFSSIGTIRNVWVLAKERQKHLWIVNVIGALSNVFLNLLLIPQFGILGAGIASLIGQFVTNVIVTALFKPYRHCSRLILRSLNPMCIVRYIRIK